MILDPMEKQRRYVLRLAGARDEKVYIGPERVYLPVTNQCNLRCRYCWFHAPGNPAHERPRRRMPLAQFKGILKDCLELKVDSIYISGEGEPTLHPHFSEMMRLLAKSPVTTAVFTNGTFKKAMFMDLVRADEIIINVGAVDREAYRLLQGEDLFEVVMDNIRGLVAYRDKKKPSLRIGVDYVVSTMNLHQRHAAERLLAALKVDEFRPVLMSVYDGNKDILPEEKVVPGVKTGVPSPVCFNGWFMMILNLEGRARFCFQRDRWEISSLRPLSFKDVWHSPAFMRARLDGKYGRLHGAFKECQACLHDALNVKALRQLQQWGRI